MLPSHSRPNAYTLLELVIASALSTLLVAGMASSIYIASQALDITEDSATNRSRTSRALDQLVRDLQHARVFSERTSTALTFTVPDRDGDESPDKLRYAWSGISGDPLTFSMNGDQGANLIEDVSTLDFTCLEQALEAREVEIISSPLVIYEGYADARLSSSGTGLWVPLPNNTADGDLLIACIVTDGNTAASLNIPAGGWNSLGIVCESDAVTLGVWWRIAGDSSPSHVGFGWTGSEQAYGWTARFTGHDPTTPIHVTGVAQGQSYDPPAPSVATTLDDCLILRIGGFDDNDIGSPGDAGMTDHGTIVMRYSNTGSGTCSGGAAFFNQGIHGTATEAHFDTVDYEQYVTVSIAIAPEQEED